jgi:hypothetical protein
MIRRVPHSQASFAATAYSGFAQRQARPLAQSAVVSRCENRQELPRLAASSRPVQILSAQFLHRRNGPFFSFKKSNDWKGQVIPSG